MMSGEPIIYKNYFAEISKIVEYTDPNAKYYNNININLCRKMIIMK